MSDKSRMRFHQGFRSWELGRGPKLCPVLFRFLEAWGFSHRWVPCAEGWFLAWAQAFLLILLSSSDPPQQVEEPPGGRVYVLASNTTPLLPPGGDWMQNRLHFPGRAAKFLLMPGLILKQLNKRIRKDNEKSLWILNDVQDSGLDPEAYETQAAAGSGVIIHGTFYLLIGSPAHQPPICKVLFLLNFQILFIVLGISWLSSNQMNYSPFNSWRNWGTQQVGELPRLV